MSDSPLVNPRAKDGRAPGPAAPRRLAADALLARRGRGRFCDRRHRGRRRHSGLQAGRGRIFGRSGSMPARSGVRSRISPPTKIDRKSFSGSASASPAATTRSSSASTTAARASAAAPFISRWCRCAFAPSASRRGRKLGYAVDWPIEPEKMWHYYDRRRGRAEDRRAGELSLGPAAAALSRTASMRSTPPGWCWRAAARRSASHGR